MTTETDLFDHIAFVTALDVPPDAVLCLKSQRAFTVEQAQQIQAQVEEVLPGRKVLILPPYLDLTVVRDVDEAIA